MYRLFACLFIVTGTVLSSTVVAADEGIGDPPAVRRHQTIRTKTPLTRSVGELVAFDPMKRTLTIKREDGNLLAVVAGRQVRNLAEIAVGDFVVIRHGRAHVISLKKASGLRGATEVEEKGKAASGANGAPRSPRKMSVVADLIAVDDRRGYLTAKGPNGNLIDATAPSRKALAAVQIGDQVELVYTEAQAVSVEPVRVDK